jgi:hypothetical protein
MEDNMATLAVTLAQAALPFVVKFAGEWVSKSAQTWVPASVANNTIEAAAFAGSKFFGDNVILGKIGSVVGRGLGWATAPFAAQSAPIQGLITYGAPIAGGIAGAVVNVAGSYLFNKLSGKTEEPQESTAQNLINQQQLIQNQLQLQILKQMQDQLNAGTKSTHVVIDNKQLEKLAAELKMDVAALKIKLEPQTDVVAIAPNAA